MEAPYICTTQWAIKAATTDLMGETVCVCWLFNNEEPVRNSFEPQISVRGTLDGSAEHGNFRVLVNDDTYAYFQASNIRWVCQDIDRLPVIIIK